MKRVKQIDELLNLLLLIYFDEVLLETVQSELALVINEDLELVAHKLAADSLDILRHGG